MSLLEVKNLNVTFETRRGPLHAIDHISFQLEKGETLGIVGESGSGKSVTSLALMRLLPPTAKVQAEKLCFNGRELPSLSEKEMRKLRGGDLAMIFQDPMSSLNPSFTVGYQLTETLKTHQGELYSDRKKLIAKAIDLLAQVGIPEPEKRIDAYPHQLSGGMCQRVMIAMAIACTAKLLIADEPTTALDVTIQAQILNLLKEIQKKNQMGMILITHDLAVVSQLADRIAVMYAGNIVETGTVSEVIQNPAHPYTQALLKCLPSTHKKDAHEERLPSIPGMVPDLVHRPQGCPFHPRCRQADQKCMEMTPAFAIQGGQSSKCHYPLFGRTV